MRIVPADGNNINDCIQALRDSPVGQAYFPDEAAARRFITDGVERKTIVAAIDETDRCLGYAWIDLNGVFGRFPYLRNIAVNSRLRGQGIGRQLLDHFEEVGFQHASRVFLLVSDFNTDAQRLYASRGYIKVGAISELVRPGITEIFMMKSRTPLSSD